MGVQEQLGELGRHLKAMGYRPWADDLWTRESNCRNVRRLLESELAAKALGAGTEEELEAVAKAIQAEDAVKARAAMKKIIRGTDLDELTFAELREQARALHVVNYSRLTKAELAYKIRKAKKKGGQT